MEEFISAPLTEAPDRPRSLEAEEGILGAILIDNRIYDILAERLVPEDFDSQANRIIFKKVTELLNAGRPADVLSVHDALVQENLSTETGGFENLNRLADVSPGRVNVLGYAEIIRDRSTRRKLIDCGKEIVEDSLFPGPKSSRELLESAQSKVLNISQGLSKNVSGFEKLDSVLTTYTDKLRELSEIDNPGAVTGVSTGFSDLDRMTSGLHEGELIIVAARPAVGKTAFALNIALHVGAYQSLPVGIFSMEMGADQIVSRLVSARGEIPQNELKSGQLSEHRWRSFYAAAEALEQSPIYVDDTPNLSIMSLKSRARQLKNRVGGKLGLLVVDYVQLMSGESAGKGKDVNRTAEISEITRGLKAMARELQVPVIALSQIKREVESRTDKRPLMSDLRESGSIEQDADLILFLNRDVAEKDGEEGEGTGVAPSRNDPTDAEVIIGKQRSGPTGIIPVLFQGIYTRFVNKAKPFQYQGY